MVYKYFSILRPVGPGTYPKEGIVGFHNYNSRIPVAEIDHMAWGFLYYDRQLSEKEANNYDLMYAGASDSEHISNEEI